MLFSTNVQCLLYILQETKSNWLCLTFTTMSNNKLLHLERLVCFLLCGVNCLVVTFLYSLSLKINYFLHYMIRKIRAIPQCAWSEIPCSGREVERVTLSSGSLFINVKYIFLLFERHLLKYFAKLKFDISKLLI